MNHNDDMFKQESMLLLIQSKSDIRRRTYLIHVHNCFRVKCLEKKCKADTDDSVLHLFKLSMIKCCCISFDFHNFELYLDSTFKPGSCERHSKCKQLSLCDVLK